MFIVDDADLSIWESQFGSTFSGLAAAVPEPSTCLVLLLAMMALHFRRDMGRWFFLVLGNCRAGYAELVLDLDERQLARLQ